MKRRIIGLGIIAITLAPVVWFAGLVMECEYPYAITIFRAAHAKTAAGDDAASVIADALGVTRSQLNWHRCSYCENFDGDLHAPMVHVQVSSVPRVNFVLAFDAKRGILYPADRTTQMAFPTMPINSHSIRNTNGTPNTNLEPISGS